ncbi:HD domain-containing protein [Streptomyces sp. NBC_00289]|uniref:HD domain-containing protein n=1 Tax=Streptomyces sp. NBC_00289 TaxID=2975703 RepID=UPI003250CF4C
MSDIIAGVEIPRTAAVTEATDVLREMTGPLLFHHSRRVFLFGSLHARHLGLEPDPELLYIAAMFHDTGLVTPFSGTEQRFEIDGADHARGFLLGRGFSQSAADLVWAAVALHTTPGIPGRMGPETAATHYGVLTDAVGWGLDGMDGDAVEEITVTHPRGEFKKEFLEAFVEGLKNRPDTTYGTVNSDVLEHFVPSFRRTSMVERITGAPWPS